MLASDLKLLNLLSREHLHYNKYITMTTYANCTISSIFVFTNIIGLSCSFGIYSLFNIQTKDKANLILTTHAFCLTERIGVQLIIAIWGEKRRERYARWSVLSQIHLENARLKMLSTFSTVRASQSLCYGNAPFGGARACIHCPPHLFDSSSLRVIYIFSLQVYMY